MVYLRDQTSPDTHNTQRIRLQMSSNMHQERTHGKPQSLLNPGPYERWYDGLQKCRHFVKGQLPHDWPALKPTPPFPYFIYFPPSPEGVTSIALQDVNKVLQSTTSTWFLLRKYSIAVVAPYLGRGWGAKPVHFCGTPPIVHISKQF